MQVLSSAGARFSADSPQCSFFGQDVVVPVVQRHVMAQTVRILFGDYAVAVPRYFFFDDRCPQLQFLNLLFMPVVMRTLVEIPQVQFSVQFVPVVTPTLVEIPQVQFLDKVYMSIVVSGAVGQTVQKTVEYPQLQFFDKVFIPVVVVSGADGQTVQKTVEYPQLQFLDKAFFRLVVWCRWPTVQETVEYPQLQFQDKAQTMLSRSLDGAKMQVKVGIGSCVILGENIEMSCVAFAWRLAL